MSPAGLRGAVFTACPSTSTRTVSREKSMPCQSDGRRPNEAAMGAEKSASSDSLSTRPGR